MYSELATCFFTKSEPEIKKSSTIKGKSERDKQADRQTIRVTTTTLSLTCALMASNTNHIPVMSVTGSYHKNRMHHWTGNRFWTNLEPKFQDTGSV